jgi:hypothetical protein
VRTTGAIPSPPATTPSPPGPVEVEGMVSSDPRLVKAPSSAPVIGPCVSDHTREHRPAATRVSVTAITVPP